MVGLVRRESPAPRSPITSTCLNLTRAAGLIAGNSLWAEPPSRYTGLGNTKSDTSEEEVEVLWLRPDRPRRWTSASVTVGIGVCPLIAVRGVCGDCLSASGDGVGSEYWRDGLQIRLTMNDELKDVISRGRCKVGVMLGVLGGLVARNSLIASNAPALTGLVGVGGSEVGENGSTGDILQMTFQQLRSKLE